MSITHIPAEMRRAVRQRAQNRCEYCGIHEDDTEFGCEVDHIISEKHLGKTVLENLALACFFVIATKEAISARYYHRMPLSLSVSSIHERTTGAIILNMTRKD